MPAGRYFIGDPRYVVDDGTWDKLLDSYFENPLPFESIWAVNIDGTPVFGFDTASGCGVFLDSEGHRYPVDSGTIGLVPESLAVSHSDRAAIDAFGSFQEFDQPIRCRRTPSGILTFDDLTINTTLDVF